MGTKKKKAQKNADFKKVKLKIGKVLKKTNTTDTSIQARKVVMLTQLQEQSSSSSPSAASLSYRGLSLDNLCGQLGHFSKAIRRNAIVGVKQILTSAPAMVGSQLRTIIPSFARLFAVPDTDSATYAQLRSLLHLVLAVPSSSLAPHFALFTAHTLRALTHSHESIRSFAVSVLQMLLERHAALCRGSADIFPSVVYFLSANKKTNLSARATLEFAAAFLRVFSEEKEEATEAVEVQLSFADGGKLSEPVDLISAVFHDDPFYFPVLSSTAATSSASPAHSPDALISLVEALAPLLSRSILDGDRNLLDLTAKCLSQLGHAVEHQPNKVMVADFDARLAKAAEPLRKALGLKKHDRRISETTAWLK